DLEPSVAEAAGHELGTAVMTVQARLGYENTNWHQNTAGCWNSPHRSLSTSTISPTVQYALAQSTRYGMRLSSSLSAAVARAESVVRTSTAERERLTSASRSSWRVRPFSSSS